MEIKKCCFTGHRPNNLPWGYENCGISYLIFKSALKRKIKNAMQNGYTHFISGMALGVDIMAAKIVLKLKKKHPNIILECAIPCKNQTKRWNVSSTITYNEILEQADIVTYVSDSDYFDGCMQERNEYMVNNSQLLIACFYKDNGGGTSQTIKLALEQKKEVVIIKPINLPPLSILLSKW